MGEAAAVAALALILLEGVASPLGLGRPGLRIATVRVREAARVSAVALALRKGEAGARLAAAASGAGPAGRPGGGGSHAPLPGCTCVLGHLAFHVQKPTAFSALALILLECVADPSGFGAGARVRLGLVVREAARVSALALALLKSVTDAWHDSGLLASAPRQKL